MKYANNYCKVIIFENRIDVIEKCLKLCEFLFEQELGLLLVQLTMAKRPASLACLFALCLINTLNKQVNKWFSNKFAYSTTQALITSKRIRKATNWARKEQKKTGTMVTLTATKSLN